MNNTELNKEISYLRKNLLSWFKNNKRTYPWRETVDPYKLLVAEMMLQRTKADQIKSVYKKFIKKYPSPDKLASADENIISDSLNSLGLRWRHKNFVNMACEIRDKYYGKIPRSSKELKSITGIGPYIAGAVASQAFNEIVSAVDSNVARVLTRYFGLPEKTEQRRNPIVLAYAEKYSDYNRPGEVNMALVDFASLICLPNNPKCDICTVSKKCGYFKNIK